MYTHLIKGRPHPILVLCSFNYICVGITIGRTKCTNTISGHSGVLVHTVTRLQDIRRQPGIVTDSSICRGQDIAKGIFQEFLKGFDEIIKGRTTFRFFQPACNEWNR